MDLILDLPMELTDGIYVAFLLICCWLAVQMDSGGGGGKRKRVPAGTN